MQDFFSANCKEKTADFQGNQRFFDMKRAFYSGLQ